MVVSPMAHGDSADSQRAAHEMCSEANQLVQDSAGREAIAIYDDVVARFDSSEDDYLQDLVAYALAQRAEIRATDPELASRGEPTADLLTRFERTRKPEQRKDLARAIVSETGVLALNRRHEQALALSKDLVAAVDDSDGPQVRRIAALGLQNGIESLTAEGRAAEAAEALAHLVTRFGEELLAYYDEVIAGIGDADRDTRLGLRYRRGELLHAMGRTDEALHAYIEIISEFGGDDDARVQLVIDRARERRAELTARME
jgi:tetratricopeptide (TPR) repeat protein